MTLKLGLILALIYFEFHRGGGFRKPTEKNPYTKQGCRIICALLLTILYWINFGDLYIDYRYILMFLTLWYAYSTSYGSWFGMGYNRKEFQIVEGLNEYANDDLIVEAILFLFYGKKKDVYCSLLGSDFRIYCLFAMALRGLYFTLPLLLLGFNWFAFAGFMIFPLCYELPYHYPIVSIFQTRLGKKFNHIRIAEILRGLLFGIL